MFRVFFSSFLWHEILFITTITHLMLFTINLFLCITSFFTFPFNREHHIIYQLHRQLVKDNRNNKQDNILHINFIKQSFLEKYIPKLNKISIKYKKTNKYIVKKTVWNAKQYSESSIISIVNCFPIFSLTVLLCIKLYLSL